MRYEAILFDLDGTLLPMDNDEFTKGYLGMLSAGVAHLGYTPDTLLPAMWKGVAAMVKNDGKRLNSEVFWEVFATLLGKECYEHIPVFDNFYKTDFAKAVKFSQPTSLAPRAVELARAHADKVVLATNPFFPLVAVKARLGWTGVRAEDFDLITHYDNSKFCKPNPAYYGEICEGLGLDPKNCLMIGNNADEDIRAAQALGMSTFLVTDCLICDGEEPDTPKGSLADLIEFLG